MKRWGLKWQPSVWYRLPTLGWLGMVKENSYRTCDYAALDGGDDGLLHIRLTEKTDLRKPNHRRYISEKFCKHGSVEQILRLYAVLPVFDRLHEGPSGNHVGFLDGEFYQHLEHVFLCPATSRDPEIAERRFAVAKWFLDHWNGFSNAL